GIAKQAATRHAGLKRAAYDAIKRRADTHLYGFLPLEAPFERLALFQTKRHWRDPSTLELISASVDSLRRYALEHPGQQIALPYPGIGMGGLAPEAVRPLLLDLPSNVTVWSL